MKENVKKELEALIQEQKDRIPKLKCEVGAFAYYVYEPSVKERYIKWRENAKRFLEINFTGDRADSTCKCTTPQSYKIFS